MEGPQCTNSGLRSPGVRILEVSGRKVVLPHLGPHDPSEVVVDLGARAVDEGIHRGPLPLHAQIGIVEGRAPLLHVHILVCTYREVCTARSSRSCSVTVVRNMAFGESSIRFTWPLGADAVLQMLMYVSIAEQGLILQYPVAMAPTGEMY